MSEPKKTIAVLGGTGKEGGGLALRWADAGHRVIIGSRTAERAEEAASGMRATLGPAAMLEGAANPQAARAADIVVLSVPFAAQQPTVTEVADALQGKILIDVTVPLVPPRVGHVQLPQGGSAVEGVQRLLGNGVRVVSAFQNISAHHLTRLGEAVECDVLVCADDAAAADEVVALAEAIGLTAWNAGPLCNSVVAEALTSVLISLNRRYKVPGSGIRLTGLPQRAA
ncbi:NADPH-dependent F420 reductase [Rhizorhabdus dicambivorans]|uniref:NADPH-dependent F420 reductase n=1 Tax=Rhizorhabdus dicambivorans TaxID=1850238 RepID=A0A2A4FTK3_9SPHN|nr:NADPH-dependent F420 reductase [Rhizorhabdus dicambivorans]ATE66164.1 NADPH-dependent F420 reductase [Rhizorhabdus dicambivorans]PCE42090.1 NADPH-dependent F420 reductase [Rhizorhabdus dicambivorans]